MNRFRITIWTIVAFLALATLASTAFAQGQNGVIHPPVGTVYDLRYTVAVNSEEVCLFQATADGSSIVDEGHPLACTNAFVADGNTANVLQIPVTPSLTLDIPVVLRASRTVNGTKLVSALSNWHTLAAALGAPVILSEVYPVDDNVDSERAS